MSSALEAAEFGVACAHGAWYLIVQLALYILNTVVHPPTVALHIILRVEGRITAVGRAFELQLVGVASHVV